MSALTRSNLSRRRDERSERVEAKHYPEAVFVPTEEQALVRDRAYDALKATDAFHDARDNLALNTQLQMGGRQ